MLKKFIISLFIFVISLSSVCAKTDRTSAEYLQNKKHFSPFNCFAEIAVEKAIKKSLKKSTGEKFDVKFNAYTLYSLKKGIFKSIELSGDKFQVNGIDVEGLKVKSLSNYNRIDYEKNPPVIETDMVYEYELLLTEKSINQALEHKEYKKTLEKINKRAYPLFVLEDAIVRIKNNKLHVILEYNFPISPSKQNKKFMVSTGLKVERNKISSTDLFIDSAYGALPPEKVANLINLLDPLTFTLNLMKTKDCNTRVENVKIIDNIIQINGKIYVKGAQKK